MDCLKRINIITGNLGSGKTEIAINLALHLHLKDRKTALVDLDIINPYFRTRLAREKLENKGLKVVSPRGRLAFADLPAMSPEIKSVIEDQGVIGVFDVGGDDVGAVALGRYKDLIADQEHIMLFVVNTCRPFTGDDTGIIRYITSIENASGLKAGGLVCNSNLGLGTDLATVARGYDTVMSVSGKTGIPVVFTCVRRDLHQQAEEYFMGRSDVLPIDNYMLPPWHCQ